jgi:hypothetical protein
MANESPIHVNYAGKLLKSRTRDRLRSFVYRFYTPYVFLIWTIIAFDYNTCDNIPIVMLFIVILSATQNSINNYQKWYSDILLMTESHVPNIKRHIQIMVAASDFIVQVICTVLSFWWIDDLHECIPIERFRQGITWTALLVAALVSHTAQHKMKNEKMEQVARRAYQHVQSSSA